MAFRSIALEEEYGALVDRSRHALSCCRGNLAQQRELRLALDIFERERNRITELEHAHLSFMGLLYRNLRMLRFEKELLISDSVFLHGELHELEAEERALLRRCRIAEGERAERVHREDIELVAVASRLLSATLGAESQPIKSPKLKWRPVQR
jgi:hypothetical protein